MNYGYEYPEEESNRPCLNEQDEPDRFCIQLYHRVVAAVDVAEREVLEVGSGRGGGASYVQRYLQPTTTSGVDFSAKAIAFCQEQPATNGLTFFRGDAEALPFEDRSFDAVFNVESSHCYGSMQRFLNEVFRVLRPGGYFLFADFRTDEEWPAACQQLRGVGFAVTEEEDITNCVIAAMEKESDRKLTLISEHLPKWMSGTFQQFAGVEDSDVLNSFRDGSLVYRRYVLSKPYSQDTAN